MVNPITNALVYHGFFRHSDMVGLAVAMGDFPQHAIKGTEAPHKLTVPPASITVYELLVK